MNEGRFEGRLTTDMRQVGGGGGLRGMLQVGRASGRWMGGEVDEAQLRPCGGPQQPGAAAEDIFVFLLYW